MDIVVNEELKAYIEPLTPEEYEALERSILLEGCRDALVLWGNVLVDGHNRYGICSKHGLPYQTVQNPRFQSMEDVHLWMIDQHLGRRSISDFQRGVLALRKREIVAGRRARSTAPVAETPAAPAVVAEAVAVPTQDALETRGRLGVADGTADEAGELVVDIFDQVAPQAVEVEVAVAEEGDGVLVLGQRQQKMLERGIFVTTLVGEGERAMQGLFELGRKHQPATPFPTCTAKDARCVARSL